MKLAKRLRGKPIAERLMFRVEYDVNGGCWLWSGAASPDGYGNVRVGATSQLAHRVAYETFRGPIGDSLVLHRCDIPACINPAHLFLGTHRENMADRDAKGRASGGSFPGEAHPMAKLSAADIRQIKQSAGKAPQRLIAAQYGISQGHVSNIINGKTWSQ